MLWLLLFGVLGMALKFGEATLAVHYRRVYTDGSTFGGPFMYMARGLNNRVGVVLGGIFAKRPFLLPGRQESIYRPFLL